MDSTELRNRLLLLARDRLQNRPGAFSTFQWQLNHDLKGQVLLMQAELMPYAHRIASEMAGDFHAVDAHLLQVIDQWAETDSSGKVEADPLPPQASGKQAQIQASPLHLEGAQEKVSPTDTASGNPFLQKPEQGRPRTAKEIKDAFPHAKWGDKLTKCTAGRYAWLQDTWAHKGSRKPGDATTFYPAKVCAGAVAAKFLTLAQCDRAFGEHFPDWLDEWREESVLLRN